MLNLNIVMEEIKLLPEDLIKVIKSEPDPEISSVPKKESLQDNLLKGFFTVKPELTKEEIKQELLDITIKKEDPDKYDIKSLIRNVIIPPEVDIDDIKDVLVTIKRCDQDDLIKIENINGRFQSTKGLLLKDDPCEQKLLDVLPVDDLALDSSEAASPASFKSPSGLRKKYFKPLKFVCSYCDKGFPQSDILRRHIRIHTGEKPHPCNICNKFFRTKSSRNLHARIHSYELKPHVCKLCKKRFNQVGALKNHMHYHHGENPGKPFSCNECEMSYFLKSSLKKHIKRMHLHVKQEVKEPCSCHECGKHFKSRDCLLVHVKNIHLAKKYYTCFICNKTILSKSFRNHMAVHTNSYNFQCALCYKRFKSKNALQTHMSYTHSNDRRFKCTKCEKTFKSQNNLSSHSEVHHSKHKKPIFTCEYCDKGFYRIVYLKRHEKIHSKDNKKFSCDVCGLSCMTKCDIERHMYTHFGGAPKPFHCDKCEMSFTKNSHLVRHQNKHTDIRPYKCDQCDKTYRDPGSLETHRKAYHLKMVFQCNECCFKSINEHSFKRHVRVSHT